MSSSYQFHGLCSLLCGTTILNGVHDSCFLAVDEPPVYFIKLIIDFKLIELIQWKCVLQYDISIYSYNYMVTNASSSAHTLE